ncbi:succinate dehydrogenase cytochrome b subunit [Zunongwangia atlantica]|uniref:Succinate dehydrogenase, cytochrome b558 subunit n=1 Tax=Zunongwangia atlantica 22II14-10F7 TaxID=1185767 RepID=A0A1Y1T4K0_9FLAO|nr:succinate dehydrogenase cytochrome b subunit [Zunongwangia atlantica]ORL45956.1 Succinate dehydrogenase, cytochrome b558 subunit [Zunongwangia atlantica 22II14-10F7]
MGGFLKSSIAKKVAMALSGLFLVLFLLQHFTINLTSVFSEDLFNELSHFMGTNFLVQAVLQPVLIFGVIFHFVMGFVLEAKNRGARNVKYVKYNGGANSSWMSRNMIYSGLVVLAFLALHFYDFWVPEIVHKYVESHPEDASRYYSEMIVKFEDPIRVAAYCLSFVFLSLHLLHGFSSSFQSMGWNNKYAKGVRGLTVAYAIIIPLGFIFIALFHYINNL